MEWTTALDRLRARLLTVDAAVKRYEDASAAVSILLRERAGLETLLMERAKRESDPWSGQWSFPGGRRQGGEPLLETARRETAEEVGLYLDGQEVLGCLEARSPGNRPGILVLPFAFAWTRTDEVRLSSEVASTAWIALSKLPEMRGTSMIRLRGREFKMPAFVDGDRTIWGFTYRMLEDLLELLQ